MSYELRVDPTILYEFTVSIGMVKKPLGVKFLKLLEIGPDWKKEVAEKVGENFMKEVETTGDLLFLDVIDLLILECPEKESVTTFLNWLERLGGGELYELLAPHMFQQSSLTFNLDEERKKCLPFLYEWNDKYFSKLPNLMERFVQDTEDRMKECNGLSHEELLLKFTGGLVVEPFDGLQTVVLTPTVHYSPMFTTCSYEKVVIVRFPYLDEHQRKQEVQRKIMNIGRALSDESRLEMLKLLKTGRYNLTEIAKGVGTTKANAHHHLLFLRIAGLLKIHEIGDKNYLYYSLNNNFPEHLFKELKQFFQI